MHGSGTADTCGSDRAPEPPPGQSPTLAWHYENRLIKLLQGASVVLWVVLALLLGVLINWFGRGRLDWLILGWPWFWLAAAAFVLACGLLLPRNRLAAGRNWFRSGRSWVRTDQLSEANVSFSTTSIGMRLRDRQGRTVSVDGFSLKHEPEVHRLVAEGVRASLENGADGNERTATYFRSGAGVGEDPAPTTVPPTEPDPVVDRWAEILGDLLAAVKGGVLGAAVSVGMYVVVAYDLVPSPLVPDHVGVVGWLPVVVLGLLRTRFLTRYDDGFRRLQWWFWFGAVVTVLVVHLAYVLYVTAAYGLSLSFDRMWWSRLPGGVG